MKQKPAFAPCPFCGGTQIDQTMRLEDLNSDFYGVWCTECTATIERLDRDAAIEAWNRRAKAGDK